MKARSNWFPVTALALAAFLATFATVPARAVSARVRADPWSETRSKAGGVSFSIDASLGVLEGTASELVYDYPAGNKFKISELTWDLKDVVMAGVEGSVGFGRRFRLNVGVKSALAGGEGLMVDRDWDYPESVTAFLNASDQNWTHESRHPDTSLDEGTMVDLSLSVVAMQSGPFSLRGIVGYKHDTWKWSARGGTFIYSTEYPGSRDLIGMFPEGVSIITYEQRYSIPHVGVGASWTQPSFQLDARLLFSPLVSASDSDYHVLRGVLFEGDFSGGTYLGLGLKATWTITRHWSAALGVEYQSLPERIGDVTITGLEGNGYFAGGGAIALSATTMTLGAGFRF